MALSAALLGCFATAASAQFSREFDEKERRWTLRNGVIEAVFQLTESDTFELKRLADLRTGDVWEPPEDQPSSPIRLEVDDTILDASTPFWLVNQAVRAIPRRGYRQTILLRDLQGLGQIRLELEMYANQPVLRYRVRFQNLRSDPVRVTVADMAPWSFDDGGKIYRTFRVNQWFGGGKLANFETLPGVLAGNGTPTVVQAGAYGQQCSWLAFRDDGDRGLFLGWEFDGRARATLRQLRQENRLELSAEIEALNRPVAPEHEFFVPAGFLGLFHGDWDEAGYRTQRFVEAAVAKTMPDGNFPYVIWDSWRYQQNFNESLLRRNAEIAAAIGIEVFVVDLGWAQRIGDWHPDPRKFPSGLRALSDYVRGLGMKFGLHFPLAEADPQSPVLRANPDWTSSETYGYFGAVSLCLSHQPVKEWIIREAVRMIDEYGVDWILQDGENMVKQCRKTTHTHDPQDSNYSNAVDGLNAVVTEIQRLRPDVHWENCEDGGNMMTFNMTRNYVTSIAADDSGPMTTRQAIYGITYPFPPRYADRYMPDDELDKYKTRSYMFGGPWIFMNRLAQMRSGDLRLAADEIRLYKSFRTRLRDGKVFHLTARPAEDRIDALQSHYEPADSSIVFVMRPAAAANGRLLRLRGLKPEVTYQIRFQEDAQIMTMTGDQLMNTGVRVNLPSMWSAEILHVQPYTPESR